MALDGKVAAGGIGDRKAKSLEENTEDIRGHPSNRTNLVDTAVGVEVKVDISIEGNREGDETVNAKSLHVWLASNTTGD